MNNGSNEVLAALARHGVVLVRVATGSMRPTLEVGAQVTVRQAAPQIGVVALVGGPEGFILHRLVARLGFGASARWVHAGDAPGSGGGLCAPREVLGVAEVARELPPLSRRARLVLSALGRAALSRLTR